MQHKDNYKRQAGQPLLTITQLCCATTLLFVSFNSHADIRGSVVRVLDGDTIEVLQEDNELTRVRLNGIDAPEKAQPFGQRSRQALTAMIAGKVVHIAGNNRDRYGRLLGTVWYDSADINAIQVIHGMAWAYRYKGKAMVQAYADREEKARKNRTGLWGEPAPVEPWRWRKLHNSEN
ncbi:thermonuclease family protein [Leclercia adecarboxylata]|uniref:Thermonuclease family protein n=1 Tax=Leclercia adecarboxylata TaxID=83655 RepID=A0A482LZN3_9ENTR|nr:MULTISPECIES: thermonuclease family protein [Enterobacteriaceae]MBZ3802765.1 thermonuclease family protein [Leclercia adecarboxylata]MBZ3807258.1 thermonuclease family protein [Leclercia adecarboxylata]MDC6624152.1 thermonuclease family protein [Leclercia adecarboxylata]MDC6635061.1 thermonuclease family protein [Leclercia adecarboxylata]MDC6640979.1 thermonuclease family protein [Leclercia adecarboxylata]